MNATTTNQDMEVRMHYFALVFAIMCTACIAGGVKILLTPLDDGSAMPIGPLADVAILFTLAVVFGLLAGIFILL